MLHQRFLFFYKGLCIFAILSINFFNFPKSNVQIIFFQNIFKKIVNVLQILICIFFVSSLFVNIFIKLSYVIGIFKIFPLAFALIFCVLFLGFFIISCLAVCFYLSLHCSCVFLLMFYMFLICLLILTIMFHHQALFVFFFSYSC